MIGVFDDGGDCDYEYITVMIYVNSICFYLDGKYNSDGDEDSANGSKYQECKRTTDKKEHVAHAKCGSLVGN